MPQDPNKLYSVYKTTMWFAIASIFLLVSLILMLMQDYGREWKKWQKKFVEFEHHKVGEELKKTQGSIDQKKLDELLNKFQEYRNQFDQSKSENQILVKEKAKSDVELSVARTRYQDFKQFFDSYKFYLEEALEHKDEKAAKEYQEKIKQLEPEMKKAQVALEELDKKNQDIAAKINALKAGEKQVEKEINQMLKEQKLLENRLNKLAESPVKDLLNAPMLDFVAPTLTVQQIVLEDLYDDFYFAKSQKVDRCTTCHLAIDRKGFEDAPQPFKTHPNLDLFLTAGSPHPVEKIGCTVCHGGSGHSLTFTHTAHTPRNEEQAKEWKKKYHWHELHKWEAKMLPLQHTQASCTKCHQGVLEVPQAPKLNEGRNLALKSGCFGCHSTKGFENVWKAGPSLQNIQSKVDREWIVKWLQNPKNFRPSTNMPQVFHLENVNSPEDKVKSNVAIEGIASYLLKNSDPLPLKTPPIEGDPEIGKKLVNDLGCLGCHAHENAKVNDHGPELIHLGSKVSREWLFTWLKDPKFVSHDTRMPNLRLSDDEASHITSYLLQSKNQKFDETALPQVENKDLDALAFDFMVRNMRHSEATEKLGKLGLEEKFEYVGREMIMQMGCFGCHDIRGFETTKPIGTELTKEGQKEVDKLYFGFVDIPHTRQAWFHQKLKNPRIFDRGKILKYHEKLRMPDFGFTDEEANSLTTFLLSLREEHIPREMKRELNAKEEEIEVGRRIVAKFNCQGCHTLDGVEGRVRGLYEDPGNAPPMLVDEGAKVQGNWLYHFIQKPSTIRPWLKIRMPTFGFNEEETNHLVLYFHNLGQQKVSFAPTQPELREESISTGRDLFIKLKCIQCHQPGEAASLTASFLAPDLTLAHSRLKPAWIEEWLKDPQALEPGTMMPTFFPEGQTPFPNVMGGDTMEQIRAIRDYLMTFTPEEVAKVKASGNTKQGV